MSPHGHYKAAQRPLYGDLARLFAACLHGCGVAVSGKRLMSSYKKKSKADLVASKKRDVTVRLE